VLGSSERVGVIVPDISHLSDVFFMITFYFGFEFGSDCLLQSALILPFPFISVCIFCMSALAVKSALSQA